MEPGRLAQLKRDVREALLNNKVIAFPIACRVAWHASACMRIFPCGLKGRFGETHRNAARRACSP